MRPVRNSNLYVDIMITFLDAIRASQILPHPRNFGPPFNGYFFFLGKAKLDCVSAFALNTLVWTWVRTQGENPKDVGVQFEINRAKKSMVRLKQIQDKAKRNPVDSQAAKRLVKGSLWTPKDDSKKRSSEETRYVSNCRD